MHLICNQAEQDNNWNGIFGEENEFAEPSAR